MARALGVADSFDAFLQQPRDSYFAGRDHLFFVPSPTLIGGCAWGAPDELAAARLLAIATAPTATGMEERCDVVLDLSRVRGVPTAAFQTLFQGAVAHRDLLAGKVRRQALIRGEGILASAIEGFASLMQAKHAVHTFESLASALAWLGVRNAPALIAEVNQLCDDLERGSQWRVQLGRWIEANCVDPTLEDAAHALALSPRTLQRRLSEHDLRFSTMVADARLQRARHELVTTNDKIEVIALRLGYRSHSAFARSFQRQTSLSPADYRRAHTKLHR